MNWDRITSFASIDQESIRAAAEFVSPFIPKTAVEQIAGGPWVKYESENPTGAFKVRGGLIYFDWLESLNLPNRRVITATRGNHGLSIAYAARQRGWHCQVVVPEKNFVNKCEAMGELGAEVIVRGRDFSESMNFAEEMATSSESHFVPSFDWKLVLGVSTYGWELFQEHKDLDAVFVPIGLGSGICGLIAAREALSLSTKIIGVVAEQAPAYRDSFVAGSYREGHGIPDTIADGVACRIPARESLDVILDFAEDVIAIPEEDIGASMEEIREKTGRITEGAAALGYAGWKQLKKSFGNSAVIHSGKNAEIA